MGQTRSAPIQGGPADRPCAPRNGGPLQFLPAITIHHRNWHRIRASWASAHSANSDMTSTTPLRMRCVPSPYLAREQERCGWSTSFGNIDPPRRSPSGRVGSPSVLRRSHLGTSGSPTSNPVHHRGSAIGATPLLPAVSGFAARFPGALFVPGLCFALSSIAHDALLGRHGSSGLPFTPGVNGGLGRISDSIQ
jgi:hypothetical protein